MPNHGPVLTVQSCWFWFTTANTMELRAKPLVEQIRHATTSDQLHVFAAMCGDVGAFHQLSTCKRTYMRAIDVLVRLELVHRSFLQGRLLIGWWLVNEQNVVSTAQPWKMYVVQPHGAGQRHSRRCYCPSSLLLRNSLCMKRRDLLPGHVKNRCTPITALIHRFFFH